MATTARRRNTRPMSYYWGVVKDMDDSQKLELVTMLVNSVKPAIKREQSDACIDFAECEQPRPKVKSKVAEDMSMEEMLEGYPYKRYTKAELNAILDEAEAEIAAGIGIDDDDLWKEDEEEFERELAEEKRQQLEAV